MTDPVCVNGHLAAIPDQRFCAVCGAAFEPPSAAAPPSLEPPPAPPASDSQAAPMLPPAWGTGTSVLGPDAAPGHAVPVPPPSDPPPASPPRWGVPPAPAVAPGPYVPMPPARRTGGSGALVAVTGLMAIAVVAVAAVLLVVKPFDGPASSPSEPVTEPPSSAPSLAVIAGETPMASPATEPTSAIRTLQPLGSEPPATDAPAPTLEPGNLDLPTCHSAAGAFTVSYPEGWNTLSDGSPWSCMLFDPQPILITPDSELPDVSVMARVEAVSYPQLVEAYRTQPTAAVLQEESGMIAGRDATAFELKNNGSGYFEKGVLETLVILDNGDAGSLVIEAVGTPGVLYDARLKGLAVIVGSLAFD